jgi:anti-sigma factor RsiW
VNCTSAKILLDGYVDDALPPAVRRGVDAHLRGCRSCLLRFNQLSCTRRLLRRLPREPMPDVMKNRLLSASLTGPAD